MIQVMHEHVVPCPQCVEKRCGLAAENSDDLFLVKKPENSIAEFRAGAFQIAEFVDYRPLEADSMARVIEVMPSPRKPSISGVIWLPDR